eukprot:1020884-Rhodomonas_salina.4
MLLCARYAMSGTDSHVHAALAPVMRFPMPLLPLSGTDGAYLAIRSEREAETRSYRSSMSGPQVESKVCGTAITYADSLYTVCTGTEIAYGCQYQVAGPHCVAEVVSPCCPICTRYAMSGIEIRCRPTHWRYDSQHGRGFYVLAMRCPAVHSIASALFQDAGNRAGICLRLAGTNVADLRGTDLAYAVRYLPTRYAVLAS